MPRNYRRTDPLWRSEPVTLDVVAGETTLLALTNNPDSSLGREAEVVMFSGASEVDPIGKAPTGSTTATVALMNSIVKRLTS